MSQRRTTISGDRIDQITPAETKRSNCCFLFLHELNKINRILIYNLYYLSMLVKEMRRDDEVWKTPLLGAPTLRSLLMAGARTITTRGFRGAEWMLGCVWPEGKLEKGWAQPGSLRDVWTKSLVLIKVHAIAAGLFDRLRRLSYRVSERRRSMQ